MGSWNRARPVVAVAGFAWIAGCALPPPPGAFVEVAEVSASAVPASRPLIEVPTTGEALLHGTAPVQHCELEMCVADPAAWLERCVEPRAMAMAVMVRRQLLGSQQWHAPALAGIRASRTDGAPLPSSVCAGDALVQETAARIVRAVGALASHDAAASCPPLYLHQVKLSVNEIDRSKESFSEWLQNDYPTIVGSTFVGIFTGAVAMPVGDFLSRIVRMELRFSGDASDDVQSSQALNVRGSASVKLASVKVLEKSGVPPEVVPVAVAAAIGDLDRELQSFVQAGCRFASR